jgi:hypothetical protein
MVYKADQLNGGKYAQMLWLAALWGAAMGFLIAVITQ